MMQLLSMRRKQSSPRGGPSTDVPVLRPFDSVLEKEARLTDAAAPIAPGDSRLCPLRVADASPATAPGILSPRASAREGTTASASTLGITSALAGERLLEAEGVQRRRGSEPQQLRLETALSPSQASSTLVTEARCSPSIAGSDGAPRIGSPLPAERARGRPPAARWEAPVGNITQAEAWPANIDDESRQGGGSRLADRFESFLVQAQRPPVPGRVRSPSQTRSPAIADAREPFMPVPRLPTQGLASNALGARTAAAVSAGAGSSPSSTSVRFPSRDRSSAFTSPAGSPRGFSTLHASAVPPPVFPSFLRSASSAGAVGSSGAGAELTSGMPRSASASASARESSGAELGFEARVILAKQTFNAIFEGLRLGPEPMLRAHHSKSPATFALFKVIDSLEYEKLSQFGDKEYVAGAEFLLCLEEASPEIREKARALMLGAEAKITYQHQHVTAGRERHFERIVTHLSCADQAISSATLTSPLVASASSTAGFPVTAPPSTNVSSPATSVLLTPAAASRESPRSRIRQKSSDTASARTGLEQVEALRHKYGLLHSPRQANSNGSFGTAASTSALLGRAQQEEIPADSGGGLVSSASQRNGLLNCSSAASSNGGSDELTRPGAARSPSFAEQWGESPTLSRIQAFRRDVLDSTRSKLRAMEVQGRSRSFQLPSTPSTSLARSATAAPCWPEAIGAAMSIGGAAVAATIAASAKSRE